MEKVEIGVYNLPNKYLALRNKIKEEVYSKNE